MQVVPEARAVAKYVRTSPRKARLVIDAIKGKRVSDAIAMLRFIPNHAAELISKVLISAAANAQDGWGAGVEELKVVNILADGGPSSQAGPGSRSGPRLSHPEAHQPPDRDPDGSAPPPRRTGSAGRQRVKPKPVRLPAVPIARTSSFETRL